MVVMVHAGGETDVSTEEIVHRWLAGGFCGDCQLGSSAYWLLHSEEEEPEDEEDYGG